MAGPNQRKRKRDRQRLLQQQKLIDDGKNDGENDGKSGGKSDGKNDDKEREAGFHDKECIHGNEEHPAKRLKLQDLAGLDNSQNSSTAILNQQSASLPRIGRKKLSVPTNPHGTEINAREIWLYWGAVQQTGSLDLHSIPNPAIKLFRPISSASGFEVMTSYNWLNDNTILVPGGAPTVVERQLPLQIERDNGTFHIDINASKNPKMPFEPMFRAIAAGASPPMFDSVDVVVNRNSLRQLFQFVKGAKDSFKIQLNVVEDTLFITRREKNNQYRVGLNSNPRDLYSFGHSFEDEFTNYASDTKGSLSHHRAIRYQFGNLELVVRHEVDAAQPDTSTIATVSEKPAVIKSLGVNEAGTSGSDGTRKSQPARNPKLHEYASTKQIIETKVQQGGVGNRPVDLVELKARRKMKLPEVLDQIWFGRTPHLINGIHKEGKISQLKHTHCEPLFKEWEEGQKENLAKLAQLIEILRQKVRVTEGQHLIAIFLVAKASRGQYQNGFRPPESGQSRRENNQCRKVAEADSTE
ncbi:hypothetical protein K4K50_010601 [Colletotrichum sp. SAR 10_71]|nr:hypothetical protein K4K50_010601 [Colletotrichum sp. SAR 10_71]